VLLTRDTLIDRLDHHLKIARQIDVAVAWAGDCDALDRLCAFRSVRNSESRQADWRGMRRMARNPELICAIPEES
jgi:hypothetical protein